jgi:hypothetical protein
MADNEETQTTMLVDGSTNTNVAATAAPDPVIDYAAQGGAKASTLPKDQSVSLKAAPATTKDAATHTTTKAAAKFSTATPSGSPRRKKAKVSTQPLTANAAATTTASTIPLEETPVWKAYVTWLDQGSVQQVQFTKCPGFRRDLIEGCAGIESEKRKKIMTGFSHLCGEGLHNFAAKVSENEKIDSKWPFVGALCDPTKPRTKDAWMWMVSMLEPYDDRNFAMHSAKCVGVHGDKKSSWPLCKECTKAKDGLFKRCRNAVDIRAGPIPDEHRIDTLVCPTLLQKRMEQDKEKLRRSSLGGR